MIRDKVVFGVFIGFLSKVTMDIFQIPIWKMKIIKHPLAHYAASLFVDPHHNTLLGSVVSLLADYIYGIFWGIIFVYLVYMIGRRNLIFKGLLFGGFLWLFSFGGLRSLPIVQLREVISVNVLYYFFLHIVFGLALGFFVKIFDERFFVE